MHSSVLFYTEKHLSLDRPSHNIRHNDLSSPINSFAIIARRQPSR